MNLRHQLIDSENDDHIDAMMRWENDPEIGRLIIPLFKEGDKLPSFSREVLKK